MADPSHRHDYDHQQEWHLQNRGGQDAITNFKSFLHNKAPSTPRTIAIITIFPFAAILLFLAGLALTGSVVGLAVSAPLFVIFSPIVIPAVLTIAFAVMGFLASGAFGLLGLSAISWIVNYLRFIVSQSPGLSFEQVTRRALETVGRMGQKVKDVGQDVTRRAQETVDYAAHDATDKARHRDVRTT